MEEVKYDPNQNQVQMPLQNQGTLVGSTQAATGLQDPSVQQNRQ
jgi:hypothetical protein